MIPINPQVKTIKELLANGNKQFSIPGYQRSYAWRIEQCQKLWEDLWVFVFEDFGITKEYYPLGNIIIYADQKKRNEIVDGQQRITTLILLFRAFYEHLQKISNPSIQYVLKDIENCIWLVDELGHRKLNQLKIAPNFLKEQDNEIFKEILTTGTTKSKAVDNLSRNYNFFRNVIKDYDNNEFILFPARILNNCFIQQAEALSQANAIDWYQILNNRGLPINTPEVFYATLYKKFAAQGDAEEKKFVGDWEKLKKISEKIFTATTKTIPLEMLLTCYTKAFEDSRNITDLKKFFEKDNYKKLLADNFIPDLFELLGFWQDIYEQNTMRFSQVTLRKFFTLLRILAARPMKALSGLFFYLRKENKLHDEKLLNELLDRYTVYILASALTGVTSNIDRIKWKTSDWATLETSPEEIFKDRKIHKASVENIFRNFQDVRNKPFVRQAVLSYWFFKDETQELPSPKDKFSIEHIVARDMTNFQKFHEPDLIESLGNMAFLESRINTRANNSTFAIKKQCYLGFIDKGKHSPGTVNRELQRIAQTLNDFTETDVRNRNEEMLQAVLDLLSKYNLLR